MVKKQLVIYLAMINYANTMTTSLSSYFHVSVIVNREHRTGLEFELQLVLSQIIIVF